MGRRPFGDRAMTAAEKQARYRAKKFGNRAPVTKSRTATAPDEAAKLREELARTKQALAQALARAEKAEARAVELAARDAARLQHHNGAKVPAPVSLNARWPRRRRASMNSKPQRPGVPS